MSKRNFFKKYKKNLTDPKHLSGSIYTQVHRIKIEYCESFFFFYLFQKLKLSYILDSLHVKHFKSVLFYF